MVNFIKNQFHQKPVSSKTTFIIIHSHQNHQKTTFIKKTPNPKDLNPFKKTQTLNPEP